MTDLAEIARVAPARHPLGMKGESVRPARVGKAVNHLDPATFKSRFALQRIAAGLLAGERRETKNGKECDRWPVCGCHRNRLGQVVNVYRQVDGQGARYGGVITCGSVWTCPVCAARSAEARRLELQLGIRRWAEQGGRVYLMTLTAPHTRELSLSEFLRMFRRALQSFKNCATYKRISTRYARAGSVRSLEVTWGEQNAWHPHTHDLIFAAPGLLGDYLAIDELRHEWTRIVLKAGLGDSSKRADMLAHGFDLQGGDYAAEYVAKFGRQPTLDGWGVSDELTRSHSKVGRRKGMTPFALLLAYHQGDAGAGDLFREYARCFEGQRMLYWSKLLKGQLELVDLTDEELARAPMPAEEPVCQLDADQWGLVLSREARGELLFWAAQYGAEGVARFLEELTGRPKTHRSTFDSGFWRPR